MSNVPTTHDELLDESLTAAEQKERVWKRLKESNATTTASESFSSDDSSQRRIWPSYDKVVTGVAAADYTHTLTCPFDMLKHQQHSNDATAGKLLCPHGVVCCVRMELFDFPDDGGDSTTMARKKYTGLLAPGTTVEHCMLRLSSAMKPPNEAIQTKWARGMLYTIGHKLRNAKLFPCAALKVFRESGRPSGNLLFGGSKIGQREEDYFAHCQSTSMTERMPRVVKPFVRKFWQYSDYPLSLGVSEFCSFDAAGEETPRQSLNFPFAVILKPCISTNDLISKHSNATGTSPHDAESAFDNFLDHALNIPENTVLFEMFACADPHDVPDASKLQRIGRLVTTSSTILSYPNDGIFFRHQRKEDDYNLRPRWREALETKIAIDDGDTQGTVGQLVGWKLFEQHIAEGTYVDFEKR